MRKTRASRGSVSFSASKSASEGWQTAKVIATRRTTDQFPRTVVLPDECRLLPIRVGYRRTGKLRSSPLYFSPFLSKGAKKTRSARRDEIEPSSLLSRAKAFAARKSRLLVAVPFFSGFQRALPDILRPRVNPRPE